MRVREVRERVIQRHEKGLKCSGSVRGWLTTKTWWGCQIYFEATVRHDSMVKGGQCPRPVLSDAATEQAGVGITFCWDPVQQTWLSDGHRRE